MLSLVCCRILFHSTHVLTYFLQLNRLRHISTCKQATLTKQKDELEGSLADLYTSCEFVEKALTHGSETEILLVKKQVEERLQEYGRMQVVKTPAENSYLVFEKGKF